MDDEWQRAAKARLVDGMLRGESWQDAVIASGLNLGRSGAYRLTWRVCVPITFGCTGGSQGGSSLTARLRRRRRSPIRP